MHIKLRTIKGRAVYLPPNTAFCATEGDKGHVFVNGDDTPFTIAPELLTEERIEIMLRLLERREWMQPASMAVEPAYIDMSHAEDPPSFAYYHLEDY